MNLPIYEERTLNVNCKTSQKYPTFSGLSQIGVDLHENGINFLGSEISDNMLSWILI